MSAKAKKQEKLRRSARDARRRNLARSIDLTYDSLRTHLADAVDSCEDKGGHRGNERWNAQCVREYAEVIYTSSVELHELTKRDFPATHKDYRAEI